MPPVEASTLLQLGAQHGPAALLAGVLLFACWRLVERMLDRQEKQLEQRDKEHREEREADRRAYLDALARITESVGTVRDEVRDLRRAIEDARPQRLRGG